MDHKELTTGSEATEVRTYQPIGIGGQLERMYGQDVIDRPKLAIEMLAAHIAQVVKNRVQKSVILYYRGTDVDIEALVKKDPASAEEISHCGKMIERANARIAELEIPIAPISETKPLIESEPALSE